MALAPGSRLGSFEITAQIGAGGMGEVYRARDRNLGRDVAIKVLPELLAQDTERMARFEREAKTLASLNHPNIAIIHGFERPDGVYALVMELVEGPTLSDRIVQGAIPLDEALAIARQIAEALEAAHENGIVHRDLKPANIKVRADGTVKVLDFGLAKAIDGPLSGGAALSMSPTITMPAMTHAGIIMGTAAYMSPEQAKGKAVDRRADIWAFGVVLAEMCTGQQLFTGDTAAEVLAGVMKDEPKLDALPAGVRSIVERCLRRDPRKRWQAIGDVRLAIEEGAATSMVAPASVSPPFWRRAAAAWVVAAVAIVGAAALAWVHFRETPQVQHRASFQVLPPGDSNFVSLAVSPDGRYLAYVSSDAGSRIWIRPIDSLDSRALPGTDGAARVGNQLFWSPDSTFIGFVAQNTLKKVSIDGGPPQQMVDASNRLRVTWGREGTILFSGLTGPVQRVPETGGTPVNVTTAATGEGHLFPHFLPDGRHFLYYVIGGKAERNGVYASSLDDGAQPVRLLPDTTPVMYSRPPDAGGRGHLLFVREGTLLAQPFDAETLQLSGEVFPVAQPVTQFSVSENGTLIYVPATSAVRQQLAWWDRSGKEVESAGPPGEYGNFRLSSDEKRVTFNRTDAGNTDIWVLDIGRGVPSRITFDANVDNLPIWSPDALRILWPSNRGGRFDLYIKSATGAGDEQLFIKMGTPFGWGTDWSRDGRFVLFQQPDEKNSADLWIAPQSDERSGEQKPAPYLRSPFNESNAVFSPDRRWVAYESDESGRQEIYVQTFPLTNEKARVSTGGGSTPAWRRDGTELFYLAADRNLMAVPVRTQTRAFEPDPAKALFRIPGSTLRRVFEPSADGSRFLIAKDLDEASAVPMTVVLNWQEGIRR